MAAWALASSLAASALFPGPLPVAAAVVEGVRNGTLPSALALTLARLLAGYTAAMVLGIPLGLGLARIAPLREAVGPLVFGLSAVPSICWLPLAILWFGLSEWAIQLVVILGAMLPIAVATESSVRTIPPVIHRAARTMGASGARLLFEVTLPAAFPGILGGAKLGWTFALRSLMAGELLFVSGGLGQLLETGRDLGDTALVLAVVLVIVLLGRASEALLFARLDGVVTRRWGAEVLP